MSIFDNLAGLSENLTRRPLKTLGEAGGGVKATSAVLTGKTPGKFQHGSPNTTFRDKKKPAFGTSSAPSPSAAALRTKKPYQHNTR